MVFLSAFFSGSEIAIFSLSKSRLKALVNKNVNGAKILEDLKKEPRKLLITILIGNNLVNIGSSTIATMIAIELLGNIGVGIATGIMTFLILVFGEITPKAYATQHAESFALKTAKFYKFLIKLLYPFVYLFEKITILLAGSRGPISKKVATEEEIKALVEMSEEHGHVLPEERELIENVLRFNDVAVIEVMTNRDEMICLEGSMSIEDSINIVKSSRFSRFPLYTKARDNIIGFVHIKDILLSLISNKNRSKKLKSIKMPALFVPQHIMLSDMFKEFQKRRIHLSMIVNDYGEIIGLVTMEDLLEELVGEIIDESDHESDTVDYLIKKLDNNTFMVDSLTEIKSINHTLKIKLPGKPTDSISAVILRKIRRIPKKKEKLELQGHEITIVDVDRKKINQVMIKVNNP
ncbi:MAG: hemolysin family protein [Nanoarchaeota archaeon]|nr:hemolysin family protein [Nanoarchaeota archaeon]